MKRRPKTILVTVAILVIVASFFIKRGKSDVDFPTYQGKTVEEWFYGTNGHPGLETTMKAGRVAFRAMGTNCLPFLLKKSATRETASNRFYQWFYPKLPQRLSVKMRPPLQATYIQSRAWDYLDDYLTRVALKPGTSPMAEEILALVPRIEDDRVRLRALQIVEVLLHRTGNRKSSAEYLLPFLQDSNFEIQLEAAILLSRVDNTITNGLPMLKVAASDTNFLNQTIRAQIPTKTNPLGLNAIIAGVVQTKQRLAEEALERVHSSNTIPAQAP